MGREEKSTGGQSSKHHKKAKQFIFHAYGHVLFEKLGTRTETCKNAKAAVGAETRCCEGRFRLVCSVPEQGSSASQMTAATVLHAIFGLARMLGTSKRTQCQLIHKAHWSTHRKH